MMTSYHAARFVRLTTQAQRPLATVMLGGKENMEQPESNNAAERASGSLERMVSCPRCGKEKWIHIPDSLADSCEGCGFVRVYEGDGLFSAGATIQEWAADMAKAANDQAQRPQINSMQNTSKDSARREPKVRWSAWLDAACAAKEYCKQKRREAHAAKDSYQEWIWGDRESAWLHAQNIAEEMCLREKAASNDKLRHGGE